MITGGYVLLVIGSLALMGLAITSSVTIYNFILPIVGIILLIVGYSKKSKDE